MSVSKKRQAQLDACALWVKALRSGRYKQTTGQLKRIKGKMSQEDGFVAGQTAYCCLGVACQLAIKEGVIKTFDPDQGYLDHTVMKWLGIPREEGPYASGLGHSLVHLNDVEAAPFKQIADVIEDKFMQKKPLVLS